MALKNQAHSIVDKCRVVGPSFLPCPTQLVLCVWLVCSCYCMCLGARVFVFVFARLDLRGGVRVLCAARVFICVRVSVCVHVRAPA